MHVHTAETEQAKYRAAWAVPEYGKFSPGQNVLPLFKQMVRAKPSTLIDIGCGIGRASDDLRKLGWRVTWLDFVDARQSKRGRFVLQNIWQPWPDRLHAAQGYCCDVMEHLPQERVDEALQEIMAHVERCFFAINFRPDHFGSIIGHPLHLTVQPFRWWCRKLAQFGKLRSARDLLGEGVFDVAQ